MSTCTSSGRAWHRYTVLLDDAKLMSLFQRYLKETKARHGPLFQALKNGDSQPLRYHTIQARWVAYFAQYGIKCYLHQLRHSYATALLQIEVSLATIRKRLGHKHIQTMLLSDKQNDTATQKNKENKHKSHRSLVLR
ncbi:MAG: tyrosine-type recombinase/integrase [Oscillochloridaceae bacterium umkhey_bin13]